MDSVGFIFIIHYLLFITVYTYDDVGCLGTEWIQLDSFLLFIY